MNIIVIDLERSVGPSSGEAHDMVVIVIHFNADFAQREVVRSDVVNYEHITLNLARN